MATSTTDYIALANEAAQLALIGIQHYQQVRQVASENGVTDAELGAADERFAAIVSDPLEAPSPAVSGTTGEAAAKPEGGAVNR